MATKQDIRYLGKQARIQNAENPYPGTEQHNPYKAGSWQATAWDEGYKEGDQWLAEMHAQHRESEMKFEPGERVTIKFVDPKVLNLPRDTGVGIAIPFPDNMPEPTREHIRKLEANFHPSMNPSGNRLVRLTRKIEKLYAKWA